MRIAGAGRVPDKPVVIVYKCVFVHVSFVLSVWCVTNQFVNILHYPMPITIYAEAMSVNH